MKRNIISIFLGLVTFTTFSAERYEPSSNYPAGSRVSYNSDIYEAKWWANPGQSPGDQVDNEWDSPWQFISHGGDVPEEKPEDEVGINPPPIEGDYPEYREGSEYEGGDIVINLGELFRCREGVTVPWCSGAAWAYEPGVGTAWFDAWVPTTEDEINNPPEEPDNPEEPEEPETPPGEGLVVTQEELDLQEASLTSDPLLQKVKVSIQTLDNEIVEAVVPLSDSNPDNVKRVESFITADEWEHLFPKRSPEYTYRHFLQAIAKYPAFCGNYDDGRDADEICRKSISTMFAHFTQETGGHTAHWDVPEWRQGLVHVREMGWDEDMRGGYNGECNPDVWQGQTWPCGTFDNGEYKSYFGRGAKQLSYNYNYGPFSEAMFGTVRTLLDSPEMVADTWLNLASAIWFFVTPQPPKPSMLHAIDGTWIPNDRDTENGLLPGLGVTTNIINGGVECGGSEEIAQSLNRIDYYTHFSEHLTSPISDDEVLGCKGMKQFDAEGAGATPIYWEKNWGWVEDNPGGKSYSCQLVNYQTPYSALKDGDYTNCVKHHFPDIVIIEDH
ncbi:chitinase [Agarivorans sp. B2Z047]|uniref:glycoside hydrolase family 19 protein n=1 Tax=Agarivorans sp. B2Z047 TaxID=2652721 RepID=UPI00128C64A2|nr:glycoside hydrolase family 19 protein [Agarivorans sp. B2Z047]MPW31813.1 chitinase [Agarivorans sp. B2Z047]UQN43719.1 chitin-binding protein [Agarivorans sp. B2Z047]